MYEYTTLLRQQLVLFNCSDGRSVCGHHQPPDFTMYHRLSYPAERCLHTGYSLVVAAALAAEARRLWSFAVDIGVSNTFEK
jgi:hypothetical protein